MSLKKATHYLLFVIFYLIAGAVFFVKIDPRFTVIVLGVVFILHAIAHNAAIVESYDDFRKAAEALKDKMIEALHMTVQRIEVNPKIVEEAVAGAHTVESDAAHQVELTISDVKKLIDPPQTKTTPAQS